MDDFIRRQYTYRRVMPNPLLLVERVWKESFPDSSVNSGHGSDDSDLGEVEEVEQQTIVAWLDLNLQQRVRILHDLCEWQLQSDKFRERIGANTELQMSQWRVLPVGQDSQRQLYYFLSDGRLYRCHHPALELSNTTTNKKRKRGKMDSISDERPRDDWTCVAADYDQWQSVVKELDMDNSPEEGQLLKYLVQTALPVVEEAENEKLAKIARLKAKEEKMEADRIKELLRQELLSTRKRSSRIATMDEKREAERVRHEEILRIQELEKRAQLLAQQQEKNGQVVSHKTREARARERELREFAVGQQKSPVPNENLDLREEQDNSRSAPDRSVDSKLEELHPVDDNQAGVEASDIQRPGPVKMVPINQAAPAHRDPSSPHQQIVATPQDALWVNQQAERMTHDIPLEHALVSGATPGEAETNGYPTEKSKEADTVQPDSEDADWVNRQAAEMSRGIPVHHDLVSAIPQTPDDSITSARTKP